MNEESANAPLSPSGSRFAMSSPVKWFLYLVLAGLTLYIASGLCNRWSLRAKQRYEQQLSELAWLQFVESKIHPEQSGMPHPPAIPLAEAVSGLAKEKYLILGKTDQIDAHHMQFLVENADFSTLVSWLDDLHIHFSAVVTHIVLKQTGQPGKVTGEIILQNAAP